MRARIVTLLFMLLATPLAQAQRHLFADASAPGSNDGTSWSNAYTSLQQAVDELQPGDTLYTRGTFFETAIVRTESVTIVGDSVPSKPTWIRGDRYPAPESWVATGDPGVYFIENISALIGTTLKPGSVVYDYKRDDLKGSVTGIDLSRYYDRLPENGAGVYYGHLKKAPSLESLNTTPNSWWWDYVNNRAYINVSAINDLDFGKLGICTNGKNGLNLTASNIHVTGVNTLCTPGFSLNGGYGIKGSGTITGTIENADIIDPGWHAAGYEAGSPYGCTLRNIRAWSSSVDFNNANNPFVFFSNVNDLPNAGHLGEGLTFHAYPLLGVDGLPVVTAFRPMLGLSHTSGRPEHTLGGIRWKDCKMYDDLAQTQAKHGDLGLTLAGSSISANDVPAFDPDNPDSYPVVVENCSFEGPGALPATSVRYERCTFVLGDYPLTGEFRRDITTSLWLRSCTIEPGPGGTSNGTAYLNIRDGAKVTLELTTIHSNTPNPPKHFFRTDLGKLNAQQCVFSSVNPTAILLVWANGWDTMTSNTAFTQCYYGGPLRLADHPWLAPRSQTWWNDNIDPNAYFGDAGAFIDPTGSNLRPIRGSTLDTARSATGLPAFVSILDLDARPYNQRYGASQSPCRGDINHDGIVSPADFTAWINAYNQGLIEADINGDGSIDPGDFTAWIASYNAGC